MEYYRTSIRITHYKICYYVPNNKLYCEKCKIHVSCKNDALLYSVTNPNKLSVI